ncbi:DUF1707 SHOCT-like domain-containing protein [Actinomadura rudentiformis]|uniref:DUF1707 SHOCT-like domain-containing protein n=1 Tax=Actinomadura rudentiformis TaxID=359158 RepID=UPI00298F45BA|nr:DUF1707 domain-containing protein [Actinomadura rudentiformis]
MNDSENLRASDADRDRVADRLREALAEGRITPEEHAERIDVVYRAKTYADLEPVLRDLPGETGPAVRLTKDAPAEDPLAKDAFGKDALAKDRAEPPPTPQSTSIVAAFAGADRRGRWLVEPLTNVTCVFGGVELDFRQAVLSQRVVTVNIVCVFGGVNVTVPPGVRVVKSNSAVFGGVNIPEDDVLDHDAPTIHLTGFTLFGGVDVRRREPGKTRHRDTVRDLHRDLHRDIHHRHRELHHDRRERLRQLRETRRSTRRDHS